jgi:hypothetical protein
VLGGHRSWPDSRWERSWIRSPIVRMKHSASAFPAQKLSGLQPRVDASIAASKETTVNFTL